LTSGAFGPTAGRQARRAEGSLVGGWRFSGSSALAVLGFRRIGPRSWLPEAARGRVLGGLGELVCWVLGPRRRKGSEALGKQPSARLGKGAVVMSLLGLRRK